LLIIMETTVYEKYFGRIKSPLLKYLAPITRPDYIKFKHISMFGPPE